MPFRVIGYDGAVYRSQLLDKRKKIVPVASFVLYFGTTKRWSKKKRIKELYKEGLLEEGHRLGLAEGLAKGHELGLTEGQKEANIENARNLFQNNAPYALVRASITQLTDAELDDIYKEVKKKIGRK